MDATADLIESHQPYDVVVVGGSVGGLSAALVLGRARLRVVVVDAGEPVNATVAHSHGFLTRDGAPPADLLAIGREEVAAYGVDLIADRVTGIAGEAGGFTVARAGGDPIEARRVVVATGMRVPLPELPGLDEVWGGDAASCPFCHGWEVRDRPIAVIGEPEMVVHLSGLLTGWSADVLALLAEGEAPPGVAVERRSAARVVVDGGRMAGLGLDDGTVLDRTALFVAVAPHPASSLLEDVGCELDPSGFPAVDGFGATSVPGVWAVGNAVTMARNLVSSAASGSDAATRVVADLTHERLTA